MIKRENRVPLYVLSLLFIFIGWTGHARERTVTLQWKDPIVQPVNEEEHFLMIHFDGAYYSGSHPTIPQYAYRVHDPVPMYSHHFTLYDKEFVPVPDDEAAVLREAGFHRESIEPVTEIQTARKQQYSVVRFFPFRYDPSRDTYEKLMSFALGTELVYSPELMAPKTTPRYAEHSVLSAGTWYRLCVDETGIYRLGHQELDALGMDPSSVRKENIRLFGNGSGLLPEANAAPVHDDLRENAIYVSGSPTGSFGEDDYILFYGRSPDTWFLDEAGSQGEKVFRRTVHLYAEESCYFVTADQGEGKRIAAQESLPETPTREVNHFRDYAAHQRDLHNLLGSGRIWFGEVFDATPSRSFVFDFPRIKQGAPAHVEAYLGARSSVSSSFTVKAGDSQLQVVIPSIDPTDHYGNYLRTVNRFHEFVPDSENQVAVELTYNRPLTSSRGWLNYLVVNVDRELWFTGGQMGFRQVDHIGPGKMPEYRLSNAGEGVTVWDVTDRFSVRRQEVTHHGGSQRFVASGDSLREFVAFDGTGFLQPELYGEVPNQDLHAMEYHDMIIVTPDAFLEEAERLAAHRRENDGLSVAVVTPRQVYNEFSSGMPDASAIRNFLRMFYERANTPADVPRYLLLFGNGTYDNKDLLGYGGNYIPTYQSYASLAPRNSYMTDDYFGLLGYHEGEGAEGIVDVGIGRFPVRTPVEAAVLVDKTIRYDQRVPGLEPGQESIEHISTISNYADWKNRVVFIGDDGDNNRHINDAETLANRVMQDYPVFNVKKIYLDAYEQVSMAGGTRYPDVNRAINETVNQGALMINYIGHGGPRGLAHQRVLTFDDIATWNNKYNMPVFMTATCEFSSFDQPDPEELSAGVRIVLKPVGGTPSLFTTTRLAWAGNNMTLNRNFMGVAFSRDQDGAPLRMGDLIRIAKAQSSGGSTAPMELRNFVLLGDPSLQMGLPEHHVVTSALPDTIKAHQEVRVEGYVTDVEGNRLHGYNGILYPTVYDKMMEYRTLANNAGSHQKDFSMRNAVLYRGKASITNGEFSFTFRVPRDIAYTFGEGKISYYMDDGTADGHGYFTGFMVGGTLDTFEPDHEGPVIELFMNDTTFVSGDHTDENPILLAFLYDESGINVTGSIGHDIVAFLDENQQDPIRLTNYYEADVDTYRSGRVVYPFRGLEDGPHTLTLRAWDTHNNPATASVDFVVSGSGTIVLEDLMNYPNPFAYDTWFVFRHNLAFNDLDVRIDIYDLQGRLVQTIREMVSPAGYRSTPIHWDGVSNTGRPLGNGVYVYRLTLTTPDGRRSRQTEKLVIFR